jgi:hypothetical protein
MNFNFDFSVIMSAKIIILILRLYYRYDGKTDRQETSSESRGRFYELRIRG